MPGADAYPQSSIFFKEKFNGDTGPDVAALASLALPLHDSSTAARKAGLLAQLPEAFAPPGGTPDTLNNTHPTIESWRFCLSSAVQHGQLSPFSSGTDFRGQSSRLTLSYIALSDSQTQDSVKAKFEGLVARFDGVDVKAFQQGFRYRGGKQIPGLQVKITFKQPIDLATCAIAWASSADPLGLTVLRGTAPGKLQEVQAPPAQTVQPSTLAEEYEQENAIAATVSFDGPAYAELSQASRVYAIWQHAARGLFQQKCAVQPDLSAAAASPDLQLLELARVRPVQKSKDKVVLIMQKTISAHVLKGEEQVSIVLDGPNAPKTTMVLSFKARDPTGMDYGTCVLLPSTTLATSGGLVAVLSAQHQGMKAAYSEQQKRFGGKMRTEGDLGLRPSIASDNQHYALPELFGPSYSDEQREEIIAGAFFTAGGRPLKNAPEGLLQQIFTPAAPVVIRWSDRHSQCWAIQAHSKGIMCAGHLLPGATTTWTPSVGRSGWLGLSVTETGDTLALVVALLQNMPHQQIKEAMAKDQTKVIKMAGRLFMHSRSPLLLPPPPPPLAQPVTPAKHMGDGDLWDLAAQLSGDEMSDDEEADPAAGQPPADMEAAPPAQQLAAPEAQPAQPAIQAAQPPAAQAEAADQPSAGDGQLGAKRRLGVGGLHQRRRQRNLEPELAAAQHGDMSVQEMQDALTATPDAQTDEEGMDDSTSSLGQG